MKPFIRTLTILLAITAAFLASAASDSQGTPGGGAGAVKVRVASNLKEKDAAQLQRYLQADGYGSGTSIEVAQDASGNFSVLIGPLESEAQANALIKDLQESGYQPEGIVQADATAEKVVSRAEAGRVFRVMVGEFPDRRQAEGLMQTLTADDYAGVDILEEGGMYKVVIGAFATERDSEKLVEQLRNDGYSLAKAIETRETAPAQRPAAIEEKEIALPAEAQRLSPEEQEKAKELIRMRERASAGLASADEIMQLREDLKKLRSEVAQVVKLVTTNEQANREKQRKLRPIQEKFNNALLAKNVQAAEAALEEMRAIDPNDPSLAFYVAQLNAVRAGPTAEGQKTEEQRRIQQLLNEAQAHLAANRLEDARIALLSMKAIDPAHPEVQKLQKEISEKQQKPVPGAAPASGANNQMLMLYVGGGALVVIVLGLAAYVFVTSRRERKILEEVQELAAGGVGTVAPAKAAAEKAPEPKKEAKPSEKKEKAKPAAAPKVEAAPALGGIPSALAGAGTLGSTILSQVATAEPEPEEEPVQKSAPEIFRSEVSEGEVIQEARPAGEADVLVLNDLVSAPSAASEAEGSGELKLPELDIPLPGLEETQTAVPPETTQEPSPLNLEAISSVNLDELMGGTREEAPPMAPAQPAPSTPQVSIHEEPTVVPSEPQLEAAVPQQPAETPAPVQESTAAFEPTTKLEAVAASTAPVASGKRVIFEQTFDDEEPGTQPRGWQGEYDYATLVVDTSSPAPGSKACLKFEKRTGAGSAHYVCRFPKASGLVVVEFDIRCDEKNKYLLGFYVEKDEDFKQSVHTIIHRLDSRSQPTLRVQGEPVPYELGSWRHVKYELNLLAGTTTAYVDGQEVVRDAKLASNYGYVNTLSIRDNLATTGVLYLDNIRIYEA